MISLCVSVQCMLNMRWNRCGLHVDICAMRTPLVDISYVRDCMQVYTIVATVSLFPVLTTSSLGNVIHQHVRQNAGTLSIGYEIISIVSDSTYESVNLNEFFLSEFDDLNATERRSMTAYRNKNNYQRLLSEDDAHPPDHFGRTNGKRNGGRSEWSRIHDLDQFFIQVYTYYNRQGLLCISIEELFQLM